MKTEFRRNLPHIYQKDAIYDINFRLANTIPNSILNDYLNEKTQLIKQGKKRLLHQLFNDHLDAYQDQTTNGVHYLKDPKIQQIIIQSLIFFDNIRYHIISYCIMSNHVHLIINTMNFDYFPLGDTLGSIKKHSAKKANELLGREGDFWHSESYDRIIRNRNELNRAIKYVINNPVSAGLVDHWRDWDATFVDERYIEKQY